MAYKAGTAFIQVTPSFSGWETRVTSYIKAHTKAVKVPVEPDVQETEARAELDDLSRERSAPIQANVNDKAAVAKIAYLTRPRSVTVRANVDRNSFSRATSFFGRLDQFFGASRRGQALAAGIAGGLPLIGPVGAPLLGGALGLAGAGLAGIGGGAIFGASLIGQIDAMKKAKQNIDSLAKSLTTLQKGGDAYKAHAAALAAAQADYNKTFGVAAQGLTVLNTGWSTFLKLTSKVTLGVIGQVLTMIGHFLPSLAPVANAIGRAVGGLVTIFGRFLHGPEFTRLLQFFTRLGPKVVTDFGLIMLNFSKAFLNIFMAFGPLGAQMLGWIVNLSKQFAGWASQLGQSKGFRQFIDFVKQNWPPILELFSGLVRFLGRLVVILAPSGSVLLRGLAALVNWLSQLPPAVLVGVATGIAALISPLAGAALGVAGLLTAFQNFYRDSAPFRKFIDGLAGKFSGIASALGISGTDVQSALGLSVPDPQPIKKLAGAYDGLAGSARRMGSAISPLPANVKATGDSARSMGANIDAASGQSIKATGNMAAHVQADTKSAGDSFGGFGGQIRQTISDAGRALTQFLHFVGAVVKFAEFIWHNFGDIIIGFLKGEAHAQLSILDGLFKTIGDLFKFWSDLLLGRWGNLWTDFTNVIRDEARAVDGLLSAMWTLLITNFKVMGRVLSMAWSDVWSRISGAVEAPVSFIITTVLDKGLIGAFNWLSAKVGGPQIPLIPDPFAGVGLAPGGGGNLRKKAGGGVLPGYTPGRDVHTFYSATGGILGLSGGEAVMRPEWTRAVGGPKVVDAMNERARRGYALGGVIGALAHPLDYIKGKVADLLHNPILDSPFGGILGHAATTLASAAAHKVLSLPGFLAGKVTGALQHIGDVLGGLFGLGGGSAGFYQTIARAMLPRFGWGPSQWPPLLALWNRESGWNPNAVNPTSGAWGIPQALPGSKMASAGADWRTNGVTQIRWGLPYIAGRYGSPAAAWAHELRFGYYDKGGRANGRGWFYKGLDAPERILSPQQTLDYERLFNRRQPLPVSVVGQAHVVADNADEIANGTKRRIGDGIRAFQGHDGRVGAMDGGAN